ncbi:MAG: hypothetical protein OXI43_09945 [Candidatus Poribacteria bacterium]|nr:hypothetical protein [Candidatus Poribacteria bacterium]
MQSKNLLCCLFLFVVLFITNGCGTDVKPTYFSNVFKDPNELDRLSDCVNDMELATDDDEVVVYANIPCLIELSKRHTSIPDEPVIDTSLAEILDNPEAYVGKILTFEATPKKWGPNHHLELYTDRIDRFCNIDFHYSTYARNIVGVEPKLDTKYKWLGMEIDLITVNNRGFRTVTFGFIVRDGKSLYKPILVEEPVKETELSDAMQQPEQPETAVVPPEQPETEKDPILAKWEEKIVQDDGTINVKALNSLSISSDGRITLTISGTLSARCLAFNSTNLKTHGSIAIRIPPNSEDLVLLRETDVTGKICGISITDDALPGTYRLLVDMTIDGVRDVWVSRNGLQVD